MTKERESGHLQNVANFKKLISNCTKHKDTYNPSNQHLSLISLRERLSTAENTLTKVIHFKVACDQAITERRMSFKPLTALASKVVNALAASGASQSTMKDAKGILRKFYGKRAKAVAAPVNPNTTDTTSAPAPAVAPPKTISVSQRSYTSRMAHFLQLIALVSAEADYNPNEPALTVERLKATLADLEEKSNAVTAASQVLYFARSDRDRALYDKETGLLSTAKAVKMYIRSVFGSASPEWRQSSTIRFRKIGMR
jgi:hypothetical protein